MPNTSITGYIYFQAKDAQHAAGAIEKLLKAGHEVRVSTTFKITLYAQDMGYDALNALREVVYPRI